MSPKPFDFRKPPRLAGNLEQRLTAWLRLAGQLAGQRSSRYMPFALEVSVGEVEALPPEEALDRLPSPAVGFRVALGESETSSLFAWPRPLVLALVAGALGDGSGALPPDRELTVVEESLCEYLMQQLLAAVLYETWPGKTALPIVVRQREPSPRWARLFGSAERLLFCSFRLSGASGDEAWYWLLPPQG